jgi:hypothetical protein
MLKQVLQVDQSDRSVLFRQLFVKGLLVVLDLSCLQYVLTDPDIIQKILDHIEAQPPPTKPATAIQS